MLYCTYKFRGKLFMKLKLEDVSIEFDFTMDCPYWRGFWDKGTMGHIGCDPDVKSPMLRKYHQVLWSKPLPNGNAFDLEFGKSSDYLKYQDIRFGSDSIITSFRYKKTKLLIEEVQKKVDWVPWIERFLHENYTIGGTIIFPKHVNSINGQRGMNPYICDRFDLTLECIRRYYSGITDYQQNPLGWVLKKDSNFFDLFLDFKGYCDFFFLQDCVSDDYSTVHMWIPTIPFTSKHPFPRNTDEYFLWTETSRKVVHLRNKRIQDYVQQNI